ESSTAPGPGSSGHPGTGSGTTAEGPPTARDELWVPITLMVLLLLTAEWLVYHRDTVRRLWRGLRWPGLPGRSAGGRA
ncbi:MAG TPA: hypothetical protein VFP19_05280, partial [Candidatus Limnocylindrales bacterium]|nr:hypothetical protein [Candidatus Limnocylindrales bacterium]